ncbi:hypothetical protein NM688_g2159 [Phlebia brevispora]|uniref:Uncharacterized protein n=1 Tax=Phlebia brevispora TaxID=194682 RepID=A0ACC1T9B2_9APHY|nr:hypothetical protein NM688_g2159 [Phlebia brevispora]
MSPNEYITLEPHRTARNKAAARVPIKSGDVILSDSALVTALFPAEKGRRCDYCHHLPRGRDRLLKCSGCAAFWYCGVSCQRKQWRTHKKICKQYNAYTASSEYQTLDSREQTDAVLLSHLLAQVHPPDSKSGPESKDAIRIFFDLLKGSSPGINNPPFCGDRDPNISQIAGDIYSRFGNNNFVVHSHLTAYAHGVFPLASRLFNHSCYPNCVVKYTITPQDGVAMNVVAIRSIAYGEEITVPYLDPALPLETRMNALRMNYGFSCTCPLCTFQGRPGLTKSLPLASELGALEDVLRKYVESRSSDNQFNVDSNRHPWAGIPNQLPALFHEAYLPQLAETFSRTSHEGDYGTALDSGRTLAAYYALIYPSNYPQIGMHALELAKTAWNYVVSQEMSSTSPSSEMGDVEACAREYLALSRQVLERFGPEGDEDGPLEEIRVLRELLQC